jgi:poly(3-hydroxybutyrate) depolymerase
VTPGVQTLNCQGIDFVLSVPDVCLAELCGMITDVHGLGMTAEVEDAHTHMRDIGGAEGYIVLQPTAPTGAWSSADDPQVRSIMQSVIDAWHPDPKRIHMDGYSMGGGMTWRFVCAYADILASAAPIAAGITGLPGSAACTFGAGDAPARQLPIFYTHGRLDGLWNFANATTSVTAVTGAWYPGVTSEVLGEASDYKWERWTNDEGTVFEFLQHDWVVQGDAANSGIGGHCFPGSPEGLGCGADTAVNWAETTLQFFVDHPME